MTNSRPRFLTRIDWPLLKQQKQVILNLPQSAELEGIINLIDAIQDYAVDSMGLSEEEVFHFTTK